MLGIMPECAMHNIDVSGGSLQPSVVGTIGWQPQTKDRRPECTDYEQNDDGNKGHTRHKDDMCRCGKNNQNDEQNGNQATDSSPKWSACYEGDDNTGEPNTEVRENNAVKEDGVECCFLWNAK